MFACALGSLFPASLPAQTLTFTGAKPYGLFGANLCRAGATTPAPCSSTQTLNYKVTAGGTLGTPLVLTLGSPDLDFTLANGTTCVGGVTTGETCAVNVTYKPRYAGGVSGAVQIVSESGTVLATTPLLGTGLGPQIGTLTNGLTSAGVGIGPPPGSGGGGAIDGAGDWFAFSATSTALLEQPPNGAPAITIPYTGGASGVNSTGAVALDGAGNIYAAGDGSVVMIPRGGGATVPLPFPYHTTAEPQVIATDGLGDVVEQLNNEQVFKLPVGCHSSACLETVIDTTDTGTVDATAVDAFGNVFVSHQTGGEGPTVLSEFLASGGAPLTLPTPLFPQVVDGTDDFFSLLDGYGIDVLLSGSKAPVSIPLSIGDTYECGNYTLTLDPAGNAYAGYYCYEYGNGEGTGVYIRSQFAPLNFGSIPVGASTTLPLGVTNTGNRTLTFKPYYVSPSYKILSASPSGCEAATAPGESCTLNIQFTALRVGPHTIQLTLSGNAPTDGLILLEGMGTN